MLQFASEFLRIHQKSLPNALRFFLRDRDFEVCIGLIDFLDKSEFCKAIIHLERFYFQSSLLCIFFVLEFSLHKKFLFLLENLFSSHYSSVHCNISAAKSNIYNGSIPKRFYMSINFNDACAEYSCSTRLRVLFV